MAIFHLSVKTIGRSAGRSATAACAYRSGEKIVDERTGLVHDYSRKRGIEHTELFLPDDAPAWADDRSALWNAAEQAETRKNSTVAREFEVAMPAELNRAQRLALVREFARELVTRHGMAVDVSIHEPGKEGDHRNHHAHILCSTRRLTPAGFADKTRELDNQKSGEVEHWRTKWAEISNRHLEQAGHKERVDHRSLVDQRASAIEQGAPEEAMPERMPTVHMGPKVVKMEQRGIRTDRGDLNRAAKHYNAQVIDLAEVRQRIAAVKANQVEQARQVEPLDQAPIAVSGRSGIAAAVMTARDAHVRTPAANDPIRPVGPDPEKIKADWEKEKARQHALIVNRAQQVHARTSGALKQHRVRVAHHDELQPAPPAGLFAGFKKAAYEQANSAWLGMHEGLMKRWEQLHKRLEFVGEYLRKPGADGQHPSKSERLAEQKAAQARPKLAKSFQQVVEKEKAAAVEQMAARIAQRQQDMNERIEEPNPRIDTTREWAEMKKRAGLARAGRVMASQNEPSDGKPDGDTASPQAAHRPFHKIMGDGQRDAAIDADKKHALETGIATTGQGPSVGNEQDMARNRAALLEKFREKARIDRENGREDRGR